MLHLPHAYGIPKKFPTKENEKIDTQVSLRFFKKYWRTTYNSVGQKFTKKLIIFHYVCLMFMWY